MSTKAHLLRRTIADFIDRGVGSFESLLMEVHAYQKENCLPYGAYCAGFPLASTWKEIPALPLPAEEVTRTFRTSGTTGEGYGQHHFATLDLYRAAALQGWRRAGLSGLPIWGLVPPPSEAPHSSLSCMAGWLVAPEDFHWPRWDELIRALDRRAEPILLFGTALAFLDLFEALGNRKIELPEGSAAVETGGYKGTQRHMPKADLYQLFTEKLGLPVESVWNEYGMTELSSQFYTHGLELPHSGAPWTRALVIDPATGQEVKDGETGILYIYDLANVDSCSAIQTRDLAVRDRQDFFLIGRDPTDLPRGCSRTADELLAR